MMTEHEFTQSIREVLTTHFNKDAEVILEASLLIQYINEKTKSANKIT